MSTGKTVIVLVGLKGSGKTYIGSLVSRHSPIRFLRVEPIWLHLAPGEDGWAKVEAAVTGLLDAYDTVMIESLGGSEGFERLRAALERRYTVKYVQVSADPDTCLRRVRSRDTVDHLPVSDEDVVRHNAAAARVALPWAAVIDNQGPATDAEILAAFASL